VNSLQLVRYNANLSSFRAQLSQHITSVSDAITKAAALQKEHMAKQSKRLASYWMLKPAVEGAVSANNRKAAEKRERIERLRQNGWRVNKERFGWKGEDYYRELRRKAEVELRGWE
jgi:regulator of replication initiation timing